MNNGSLHEPSSVTVLRLQSSVNPGISLRLCAALMVDVEHVVCGTEDCGAPACFIRATPLLHRGSPGAAPEATNFFRGYTSARNHACPNCLDAEPLRLLLQSARAVSVAQSPTQRGLMNTRYFAVALSDLSPRAGCCRLTLFSPPGTWLTLWLLTAHCVSRLHTFTSPTPSIFVHGSCLPVNKDRCGLRVDRLLIPACLSFPPTPLLRHGVGSRRLLLQSQTIFTLSFPLYPRHLRLRLRGWGRSHYSVPRNLRLLFRAVDDGLLRFLLISHD